MNNTTTNFTQRNVAIDIFRALTMFVMIFVNDLWTISGYPTWLGHAAFDEDMLGFSDVVFPCFLFVVGMSIPFAVERRFSKGLSGVSTLGHILIRSLALLLMGVFTVNSGNSLSPETGLTPSTYRILMVIGFLLVWNVYPRTEKRNVKLFYTILKILGLLILLYLALTYQDNQGGIFRSRWWGILGLIGWSYLICALVYLFTRDRLKYLIPVWLIFVAICVLETTMRSGNMILDLPKENFLDQLIGLFHINKGCLPALTMGGVILSLVVTRYGHVSNGKKLAFTLLSIASLLVLGFFTNRFWIISKIQETPPWIFFCIAAAIGVYAIIYWLVEKGKARWFNIIKVAGTATLTCYLVPFITYSLTSIAGIKLPVWLTVGWVGILNCIAFSLIVIGITYLLGKIHIKLKI